MPRRDRAQFGQRHPPADLVVHRSGQPELDPALLNTQARRVGGLAGRRRAQSAVSPEESSSGSGRSRRLRRLAVLLRRGAPPAVHFPESGFVRVLQAQLRDAMGLDVLRVSVLRRTGAEGTYERRRRGGVGGCVGADGVAVAGR
ncbi:hypothetical protein N8I84_02780 [Streptomyces cynarae]|uniref:Uncharacterized protein n=1 Tax=Streptomyces cynarae TaxID=2981134 RepID=A0ABY6EDC3_9ACTN|nr:hypothetical protein [Streptomyces cynarae]UXY24378.1 hypothetical protein N8I84_02780 [Streptomyces cynarae]